MSLCTRTRTASCTFRVAGVGIGDTYHKAWRAIITVLRRCNRLVVFHDRANRAVGPPCCATPRHIMAGGPCRALGQASGGWPCRAVMARRRRPSVRQPECLPSALLAGILSVVQRMVCMDRRSDELHAPGRDPQQPSMAVRGVDPVTCQTAAPVGRSESTGDIEGCRRVGNLTNALVGRVI